jgi:flagellar P-ring protein precursor FlgI
MFKPEGNSVSGLIPRREISRCKAPGALWIKVIGLLLAASVCARGGSPLRVKDLVRVAGADESQLVGFGLVTGLAGDGDKNPVYTVQAFANMLQRFGMSIPATAVQSKNVAAVMVTAEISGFAKSGSRLDVHVSSMGDAKSLSGGILLQTPLLAGNGKMYGVAQGPLVLGGFSAGTGGGGGASVQKNHPTVAIVPDGGKVVSEVGGNIVEDESLELLLKEPDFTSIARLTEAINAAFTNSCESIDSTTVRVKIPKEYLSHPIDFLSRLEALEVTPDTVARVVVNERTGTIVANSLIRIGPCAVSHGNLSINIASSLDVSQPGPLSQGGETVVTPRTDTTVVETKSSLITLPEMPTIEKVASSLNALGVSPRDMISILMHMKKVGALQAELRVN